MDPNATLTELRELLADGTPEGAEMALERFEALDEWLSKGGYKPADWAAHD